MQIDVLLDNSEKTYFVSLQRFLLWLRGGLLFELLGQSSGHLYIKEDDILVVLRLWHAQSFLVTALHVKSSATNVHVQEFQKSSLLQRSLFVFHLISIIGATREHITSWTSHILCFTSPGILRFDG
ncbi:magnesium transporter CorA-like family protein [Artemisia annua]|uniref:Magnesium transporter CorA-like family protein n=1 Tax=Artemisia annua TaxID=35608 RepID=A0A2U1QJ70_ARTAN|nr:magnesium transporter CorA-like family protein [Artemisia annua]